MHTHLIVECGHPTTTVTIDYTNNFKLAPHLPGSLFDDGKLLHLAFRQQKRLWQLKAAI